MKEFKFKIGGNSYKTSVNEISPTLAEVTVNGTTFSVEIEREETVAAKPVQKPQPAAPQPAPAAAPVQPAAPTAAPAAGAKVESPLPGSVIKVMVTEGQAVKRGDTLLTLESMKMENIIQAEQDGTVKQIAVVAGQNVMQGDLLVVIG